MYIIDKELFIRSATLDDAVMLNKWFNDKSLIKENIFNNYNNQSLKSTINLIKQNKTSLNQLLIVEINQNKIGFVYFNLYSNYSLINYQICDENFKQYEEKILKKIISYLFSDENINNIYNLQYIKIDISLGNIKQYENLNKIGFYKDNIKYGIVKDNDGEIIDALECRFNKETINIKNNFLNKYTYLLFDVDNTLLDFDKAEKEALKKSLSEIGFNPTEQNIIDYHLINDQYWKKVEKGEISRDECLTLRFKEFFELINVDYDPFTFGKIFRNNLNQCAYLIRNAKKVLDELSKTHTLYIITNGVLKTQLLRTKKAGLDKYFEKKFISEEIGFNKPSVEFYNEILKINNNLNSSNTIIIGDSLTSDIKLGINNKIDTVWYNRYKVENNTDIHPTYEIHDILDLIK